MVQKEIQFKQIHKKWYSKKINLKGSVQQGKYIMLVMTEPQLLLIKSQTNKTSNTTRQYNCLVVFDVLFVCWGLRGGEGGLRGKKKYCRISLFQAKDQQLIDTLECISKHRLEQTRSAALKSVSFLVYYVLLLLKFSLPDKKNTHTHTKKVVQN